MEPLGPAPAWIAGAKDRTEYLIAQADENTSAKLGARKAAVNKLSGTKAGTKTVVAKRAPAGKKAAVREKATATKKAAVSKGASAKNHQSGAKEGLLRERLRRGQRVQRRKSWPRRSFLCRLRLRMPSLWQRPMGGWNERLRLLTKWNFSTRLAEVRTGIRPL